MKRFFQSHTITTGLAIFSMFFGAGNLMYPIVTGIESGTYNVWGIMGFLSTAVCLPLLGLIAMILFDGDYDTFFQRLGYKTGNALILACMVIIGPLIAMPRIITLSHTMIAPFLPLSFLQEISWQSSFVFALIFLTITFIATYRESKIVDLLGYVISPLLLISLVIIIIKGCLMGNAVFEPARSTWSILGTNIMRGYETLDLLGAIFFASIILTILKRNLVDTETTLHERAVMGIKAGSIGLALLSLVYIGMSYLGVFHGAALPASINAGEIFREISFVVLGPYGAIIIAIAVLMACLSTAIGLSAVLAEYIQHDICREKVDYITALIGLLILCIPLSTVGLGYVLKLTGGAITFVGYPIIIALTVCNIAYKLFGFKPVRIPVALTFIGSLILYIWF